MGHLEVLGKDVPMSFSHGTYFADSKMVERHKFRAKSVFLRKSSVPLKCSKMHRADRKIGVSKHEERLPQNNICDSLLLLVATLFLTCTGVWATDTVDAFGTGLFHCGKGCA